MSRVEDIDTGIWEDEDFDRLSADAALLYLWSFTNARCPMSGVYKIRERSLLEGRMTVARRKAALEELVAARFVVYEGGWLWVRTRVKYLRTRGEKMAASIVKDIKRMPPDQPIRALFLTEYLENCWVSRWLAEADFDTPSIPLPSPSDGCKGLGLGKGPGSPSSKSPEAKSDAELSKEQLRKDWDDWLAHFIAVTDRTATRDGSKEAKKLFAGRRKEGRSLDELKAATVGAHSDPHLREKGFDRPETILREGNIARYIELAAKSKPGGGFERFLHKEVGE